MECRNITRKTKLNLSEEDIALLYDNNLAYLIPAHTNISISLQHTKKALEEMTKAIHEHLRLIKKTKRYASKQDKSITQSIDEVSHRKRSI